MTKPPSVSRALFFSLGLLGACSPAMPSPEPPPKPEPNCPFGQRGKEGSHWVADWPIGTKSLLAARLQRGPVAVEYRNGQFKFVDDCELPGKYTYTPSAKHSSACTVTEESELNGTLPLVAAELRADLKSHKRIGFFLTSVGGQSLKDPVDMSRANPACSRATHVVRGISYGAYARTVGLQRRAEGRASISTLDLEARLKSEETVAVSEGDLRACAEAPDSHDPRAPCNAILLLELTQLERSNCSLEMPPSTIRGETTLTLGECLSMIPGQYHLYADGEIRLSRAPIVAARSIPGSAEPSVSLVISDSQHKLGELPATLKKSPDSDDMVASFEHAFVGAVPIHSVNPDQQLVVTVRSSNTDPMMAVKKLALHLRRVSK